MAIYDTMQYIKCDVSTICIGMAASMGAFLLSSGAKGKRYRAAERRDHDPSAVSPARRVRSTDMADPPEAAAEIIKKRMNEILADNTGKPLRPLTADMRARQLHDRRRGCQAYGLIDKVFDKH